MSKLEKIFSAALAIVLLGVIGIALSKYENPSPSLGFTSLTQRAYVTTSTATQVTTTIYTFPGVLHTITITNPVSNSVIKLYDSNTTTAPTITPLVITIPSSSAQVPFTLTIDGIFNNGLTIQQATATSTVNVTYQQQ